MESTKSLELQLKKANQELSGHKIELHQTRGYLQCILQNSNDMIFATDVDGILVSFSKGGEKVIGYSWEEVGGSFIKDLSENPDSFEELMVASQEKGSAVRLEFPFRHKKGNTVYCDVSLINLTNTKGQRVGTVGVCRDITRWKKLQQDLIRIDRLAEIGRIASGIAHEINNPLAVINEVSGWAEEVVKDADGLDPEDKKELDKAIKQINEQTRRCRGITHQLLGFVRDSAPEKTEFDLHELIKETINFLKPELRYAPIEVVFDFSNEPLPMKSDPRMMEQIFVNLLSNAIHAIREKGVEGGRIEIKTAKNDAHLEIRVEDNGIGIPDETKEKIFGLFFTTKPPGKGTGLGLSICQNIIKNLGGSLSFESQYGDGTTFTIRLPYA
jgi:two-component system NtrC family sensor kinase